ncbi:MAG: acyltransferase family protein [Anaerolineales bacterium]|nr:acyltransferase family protein [Anaerolineales bacterium]
MQQQIATQSTQSTQSSHLRWVDLVRVLGSFFVVMAHLSYTQVEGTYPVDFYYAFSRIAVPLFFLLSGYLLLQKDEPLGVFFKKRAWKIFLPFIIWSLIYMWQGNQFADFGPSWLEIVSKTVMAIVRSPRAKHLWFFYSLIGLYLATPILRLFVSKAKDSGLLYFIAIWILAEPVALFLGLYTRVRIGFEWNFFTGYIGYFVLGYYLGKREYTRNQLMMVAGLFLFSVFVTFAGIHVTKQIDPYIDYFERYLSLNVIVMAASGFVLLSRVPISDGLQKILVPQSRASFGIYLIHIIFIGWMMNNPPFNALYASTMDWLVIPVLTLVGYVISFAVVFVMQKIPVLRSVVP